MITLIVCLHDFYTLAVFCTHSPKVFYFYFVKCCNDVFLISIVES